MDNNSEINKIHQLRRLIYNINWPIRYYRKNNKMDYTTIYKDKKLIASFAYAYTKKKLFIIDIMVHPNYRRQGIASNMIKEAINKHQINTFIVYARYPTSFYLFRHVAKTLNMKFYPNNENDDITCQWKQLTKPFITYLPYLKYLTIVPPFIVKNIAPYNNNDNWDEFIFTVPNLQHKDGILIMSNTNHAN